MFPLPPRCPAPPLSWLSYPYQVPATLRFVLDGEMPPYLLAKDLILQAVQPSPTSRPSITHQLWEYE
ncbi:hypothetical protein CLOM_g4660 [Closterium sp. NIES-68]|nr:hypothetical protein CLOM_g4660 [Closterium sp. NIES-68]